MGRVAVAPPVRAHRARKSPGVRAGPWFPPRLGTSGGPGMSLRDDRAEIDRMLDKIVELARRRGYTAGRLEEAADLATNRISKWRDRTKQRSEPTARQLWRIARVLGAKIDYF